MRPRGKARAAAGAGAGVGPGGGPSLEEDDAEQRGFIRTAHFIRHQDSGQRAAAGRDGDPGPVPLRPAPRSCRRVLYNRSPPAAGSMRREKSPFDCPPSVLGRPLGSCLLAIRAAAARAAQATGDHSCRRAFAARGFGGCRRTRAGLAFGRNFTVVDSQPKRGRLLGCMTRGTACARPRLGICIAVALAAAPRIRCWVRCALLALLAVVSNAG